jgi:hypothetical protein
MLRLPAVTWQQERWQWGALVVAAGSGWQRCHGSTRGAIGSTTHPETRNRRGPDPGECCKPQKEGSAAGLALHTCKCGKLMCVACTI